MFAPKIIVRGNGYPANTPDVVLASGVYNFDFVTYPRFCPVAESSKPAIPIVFNMF